MIHSVQIKDISRCCIPWWDQVEWLKGQEEIQFQPGLNIIFGPNGSGKSTLLKLMARTLCCAQGGVQAVTREGVFGPDGLLGRGRQWDGVLPLHDGAPVLHFDPGHAVGMVGGYAMTGFDSDFFTEGVANTIHKGSSGETNIRRMNNLAKALSGKWPELKWKLSVEDAKRAPGLKAFLQGNTPKESEPSGVPTILLDEPSRSLSIPRQISIINKLTSLKGVQVIMATHSPFTLGLKEANYINTSAAYSSLCQLQMEEHLITRLSKDRKRLEFLLSLAAEASSEE